MTIDYEQIAFDYLVKLHMGDEALIKGWRSNADLRWMLTLQLCKSLAEGKQPSYSTAGAR